MNSLLISPSCFLNALVPSCQASPPPHLAAEPEYQGTSPSRSYPSLRTSTDAISRVHISRETHEL
ncbi:hypothetical protein BD310DRAFT_936563 [Dichomitus squalens]|uniref:Uncharacterized protein n=1 Tax=Dichomitus squalens TaxID=114155 RepID=A0A4Q9PJ77_9APHY|nr:hypothetical protein BD310DRAFT_936563 [Dichomitus squalens]